MINQPIYTVGGTVQAGDGIYILRPADHELLQNCLDGKFCYVLTARQMGKSSLMVHISERLAAENVKTVLLDLTILGTSLRSDQWYLGLIDEIVSQLELSFDYISWWENRSHLGPTQKLSLFLRRVVLELLNLPVVIFVDEIDITISLPFADDFFASIRACYNARGADFVYRRLSFVLLGVATPGDLIHDATRTPFNIGERINLANFTRREADALSIGLGNNGNKILDRVFEWTNGHPYLTQRLCAALSNELNLKPKDVKFVAHRLFFGDEGGKDHNLRFVSDMLLERADDRDGVLRTYLHILQGKKVEDEDQSINKSHLKLSGIVLSKNRLLQISNRIYQKVFNRDWIKEYLPRSKHEGISAIWIYGFLTLASVIVLGSMGWIKFIDWLSLILATVALIMVAALWFKRDAVAIVGKEAGRRVSETVRRITQRIGGAQREPKAHLEAIRGLQSDELRNYDIFGETPIGRNAAFAELVFGNVSISGLHCVIHLDNERWTIEDSESSNGTFLNGKRLPPFMLVPLKDGDIIELAPVERGGVRFRFTLAEDFSFDKHSWNESDDFSNSSIKTTPYVEQKPFYDDDFEDNDDEDLEFDPSAQEF